jgi:NIPSNAP protein
LAEHYDVTIATVRPNMHPPALAVLGKTIADDKSLLACWYSDLGTLNQIMMIRKIAQGATTIEARHRTLTDRNPFGIGEFITGLQMDTYVSFDFMPPLRPGDFGPCYEVRTYMLKPDALTTTVELWRKAVPGRSTISPVLAAMSSLTGAVTRFLHIWPYPDLNERVRLRAKAIAEGVWPPPGGPDLLATQQSDIYLPAPFSPMK